MAGATVVLSYHEIILHQSDVKLLDGPYWLDDTIISFYFEYLERAVFSNNDELLFVSPEVTQCVKMVGTDEINTFLEPLGISRKNFIFFALNNNNSPDVAGGTHWSLLVYSRPESCFYHLDSSSGTNHNVAWEFANHVITYFSSSGSVTFVDKECFQQNNDYDCGIYLIYNTERLAECAHINSNIGTCDMTVKFYPGCKRKKILGIIRNLASSR